MNRALFAPTALLSLVLGCTTEAPEPAAAATQTAEIVELGQATPLTIRREFAGLVVPRQNVDMAFEIAGKITAVAADEGSRVAAGAVLAELDTAVLRAQRDELTAQVEENEAQKELNAANRQRIADLKTDGFAAQQRVDELHAEQRSLAAQRAGLQARLARNSELLEQSVLKAPFAGTVVRRFLDVGAVAAPGVALLQLIEGDGLEARIGVPVRLVSRLEVGANVALNVAEQVVNTKILAIGNDVSRSTLTVPVRVSVPAEAVAIAGDQAYLEIEEALDDKGYWLPLAAVTDGLRGLWNVYALDAQDRIETRDVHILYADGERAFVSGALAAGDRVVRGGLQRLVPRQLVTPQTAVAQAPAGSIVDAG